MSLLGLAAHPQAKAADGFKSISVQFIAALADADATSGTGAESWGLWRVDPGPRGVELYDIESLLVAGGVAPARWTFSPTDWWLEEHGLIMEQPDFGMPPGRYLVTGNQSKQAVLTIHPKDASGSERWELSDGVTIGEVTHLGCRSARYTPAADAQSCSPVAAHQADFPVSPGAAMPPVPGCHKQDYAVVFIIGVEG
jgi:hypothetical protein